MQGNLNHNIMLWTHRTLTTAMCFRSTAFLPAELLNACPGHHNTIVGAQWVRREHQNDVVLMVLMVVVPAVLVVSVEALVSAEVHGGFILIVFCCSHLQLCPQSSAVTWELITHMTPNTSKWGLWIFYLNQHNLCIANRFKLLHIIHTKPSSRKHSKHIV